MADLSTGAIQGDDDTTGDDSVPITAVDSAFQQRCGAVYAIPAIRAQCAGVVCDVVDIAHSVEAGVVDNAAPAGLTHAHTISLAAVAVGVAHSGVDCVGDRAGLVTLRAPVGVSAVAFSILKR